MVKEAISTVPKKFKPPGGKPEEITIYVNAQQLKQIQKLLKHRGTRTKDGVLSFYDPDGAPGGTRDTGGSNTASGNTQGSNQGTTRDTPTGNSSESKGSGASDRAPNTNSGALRNQRTGAIPGTTSSLLNRAEQRYNLAEMQRTGAARGAVTTATSGPDKAPASTTVHKAIDDRLGYTGETPQPVYTPRTITKQYYDRIPQEVTIKPQNTGFVTPPNDQTVRPLTTPNQSTGPVPRGVQQPTQGQPSTFPGRPGYPSNNTQPPAPSGQPSTFPGRPGYPAGNGQPPTAQPSTFPGRPGYPAGNGQPPTAQPPQTGGYQSSYGGWRPRDGGGDGMGRPRRRVVPQTNRWNTGQPPLETARPAGFSRGGAVEKFMQKFPNFKLG